MIFAAGLGTRLGGITREQPKALVPVAGVPMIERVARRLRAAGADRLVVNTHHFAERVMEYIAEREGFGMEVVFSPEKDYPLETGGGLLHAASCFRGDAPFFIHNADILSDLPLPAMYKAHADSPALVTLAVMRRPTRRFLLFDDFGLLGRADEEKGIRIEMRKPRGEIEELAFAGVHVAQPALLARITERGAFSILDPYLRLVGEGERISPFRIDGHLWIDVGRPDQLDRANRLLASPAS